MTLDELIMTIRKMNCSHVWIYEGNKHYATVQALYISKWFEDHKTFMRDVKDVLSIEKMDDTVFPNVKVCFEMFD